MLLELEKQVTKAIEDIGLKVLPIVEKATELFTIPKLTPCARIIVEKVTFSPISAFSFSVDCDFSVFLFFRSLREKGQGAYEFIESIISALVNKTYFNITPLSIELFYHESGEFSFRIAFKANGRYVVPQEEEPLTTRITYFEKQDENEEFVTEVSK